MANGQPGPDATPPFCSPAVYVGEDSLGEPPVDSYDLATAYPQQQQHVLMRHAAGMLHSKAACYIIV